MTSIAMRMTVPPGPGGLAASEGLRQRRRHILLETVARIGAGDDLERDVLPALYKALAIEIQVDALVLVDPNERASFAAGMDRRRASHSPGQRISLTSAATRRAMHLSDIRNSLDPITEGAKAQGMNACACEPLLFRGRLLGTLCFASRTRRSFAAEDLLLFEELARHIALARARQPSRPTRPLAANPVAIAA